MSGRWLQVVGCLFLMACGAAVAQDPYTDAMTQGRDAMQTREYQQAHDAYLQAVAQAPNADAGAQALNGAASALTRADKLAEAIAVYQRIVDLEDVSTLWKARALEQIGSLHLRQKAPAEAKAAFQAILDIKDLDPNRLANAKLSLGGIAEDEKRADDAKALYREVFANETVDPDVRARAGLSLADLALPENPDEARTYYKAVRNLDWEPVHYRTQAIIKTGDSYLFEKKYDEAREAYQVVIDFPRSRPSEISVAYFKIADSYQQEGKLDEAKAWYQKVVDLSGAHGNYVRYANSRLEKMEAEANTVDRGE